MFSTPVLKALVLLRLLRDLEPLLTGLLSVTGEPEMNYEFTPEQIQEVGKLLGKEFIFSILSPEDLADIPLEKRLAGIPEEKLLAGIPVEKRLTGLSIEEIENYLKQRKQQD